MKTLRKNEEKEMIKELFELNAKIKEMKKREDAIKKHFKSVYDESFKSGDLIVTMKEESRKTWVTNDLMVLLGDKADDYRKETTFLKMNLINESAKKAA